MSTLPAMAAQQHGRLLLSVVRTLTQQLPLNVILGSPSPISDTSHRNSRLNSNFCFGTPFGNPAGMKRSEEAIDYVGEGPAHPDRSTFLGFIVSPTDSSVHGTSVFEREDAAYEKAITECHRIRESPHFSEGVLLKCVENKPLFPFLHLCQFVDGDAYQRRTEMDDMIMDCGASKGSLYGGYEEVYSIQKTSAAAESRLPTHRHAGFITVGFKLLDDSTKQAHLEKTWLSWTGAREIYKYAPRTWNLRRISLLRYFGRHPSAARPFAYLLLCEFGSILHPVNTVQALDMCERLRVRNCGHVALFQVHTVYTPLARPSSRARTQEQGTPKRNPMMRGFSQDVDCHTEPRRGRLRARQKSLQYTDEQYHQMHRNSPV